MNLIEIAQAWISSYNPTPEQQKIADDRIRICNTCEYKKHIAIVDTWVCGKCNCPLKKKIFSSNKRGCPAEKWTK